MEELIESSPKKLYKSKTEKVLFGVCGGIAEYYFIDPTWVRLVFVFLAIAGGSGFLIYLILAVIMPSNGEEVEPVVVKPGSLPEKKAVKNKDSKETEKRRTVLGLVIVLIGILAFFKAVLPIYWIDWDILWPIIIILIGFSVIVKKGS